MDVQFTDICKIVVEHFEANDLFASDTKSFTSTQIQETLCKAAQQKTSIEDIAEQKRKEDKTIPTVERYRTQLLPTLSTFHGMNLGSIFLLFFKLLPYQVLSIKSYDGRPLTFGVDETDLEYAGKGLYHKKGKKATFYKHKKQKVFRYATLVAIQKGERPLTLAFLPVILDQKRKDTVQLCSNLCRECA